MTIQAQLADGRVLEFPDGTDPAVIQNTVQGMIQQTGQSALGVADALAAIASQGLGSAVGGLAGAGAAGSPLLDITTQEGEQISEEIAQADIFNIFPISEEGKKTVRAIGENETLKKISDFFNQAGDLAGEFGFDLLDPIGKALGIDNLGAIAGAAGKISPDVLIDTLTGGAAAGVARAVPRAARAAAEAIPEAAQAARDLVPVVQDVFQFETPTKKKLTELIQSGSTDIETARFELTPSPLTGGQKVVADQAANEALKQGFDEGVVAAVKQASPADKTKMLQMTNIMEKGKKNARFAALNRPSDVAGDSLLDRFKIVRRANIEAGQQIGNVAKSLKGKEVDPTPATDIFLEDLADMGISPTRDADGSLSLDFKGSDIEGLSGPMNAINNIFNRMTSPKKPDAFELHRLKRFIDEQVTFGKNAEGLAGKAEIVLKGLRRNIDGILDTNFPEYNQVNTVYSETISALDAFQDVAGNKMNLIGPNAEKAVGTLLRRTLSNAQSRVRLLDSIDEIESVAKKFADVNLSGVKRIGKATEAFTDDLLNQVLFVDELDRQFGAVARTSFQGQIQQGIEQAGRATTRAGALDLALKGAGVAAEKARGINDAAAFKSIKELLRGN